MAILFGYAFALLATATAWVIAGAVPVTAFPKLAAVCQIDGLGPLACSAAAVHVGLVSTATLAIAALASLVLARGRRRPDDLRIDPSITRIVLLGAMLLVLAHLLMRELRTAQIARTDEIATYAAYISLESLAWPLLVQMLAVERNDGVRVQILAVLVALMALSPFRSELLSILAFGLAAPLLADIWRRRGDRWPRAELTRIAAWGGLAVALAACVVWSTSTRGDGDDPPTQADIATWHARLDAVWETNVAPPIWTRSDPLPPVPLDLRRQFPDPTRPEAPPVPLERQTPEWPAIVQRIVAPVFQASALARHGDEALPGPLDEIGNKLHIARSPTLNQYLYQKYFGTGDVGQTTTLYYGEAVAYFPWMPVLWMIAAPLGLIVLWLVLRRTVVDAQTLFGIAVWRSSLAGVITILPSLVVQTAALIGMAQASFWLRTLDPQAAQRSARAGRLLFVVVAAILLIVECRAVLDSPSRNSLWRVVVGAARRDCTFERLEPRLAELDKAFADRGVRVHTRVDDYGLLLSDDKPVMILVDVPDGLHASALSQELIAALKGFMFCRIRFIDPPPVIIADWTVRAGNSLPLEAFAIALLVVSLGLAGRRPADQ